MEPAKVEITLREMPIGCRLLVRSRRDWRVAVVARVVDDKIVLSVASPKGRNYRLRRDSTAVVVFDGAIPYLPHGRAEEWRDNLTGYDTRW